MNMEQVLVLAGGAAVGAALLLGSIWVAVRRARRGAPAGSVGAGELRRMGRRIRQLERIARRTEERLNARMDELRRLLAQADDLTARGGGLYVPQDVPDRADADGTPKGLSAVPAMLEKQRDQIFRLRLQGLETVDIARRMRLPIGEVELTLKLARTQQRAGAAAVADTGK
jgi:DNA-directed RNA polymerase specialized sigma24 family protein